jgi:uncharacterized membrane protein HdeD (DUF308 family)
MFLLLGGALGLIIALSAALNHRTWEWAFGGGVVGILFGAVLWKWPAPTVLVVMLSLGLWAIAVGLFGVANAIACRAEVPHAWLLAVASLGTLLFGIMVVVALPTLGLSVLIALTGIFIMIYGVVMGVTALRVRTAP